VAQKVEKPESAESGRILPLCMTVFAEFDSTFLGGISEWRNPPLLPPSLQRKVVQLLRHPRKGFAEFVQIFLFSLLCFLGL